MKSSIWKCDRCGEGSPVSEGHPPKKPPGWSKVAITHTPEPGTSTRKARTADLCKRCTKEHGNFLGPWSREDCAVTAPAPANDEAPAVSPDVLDRELDEIEFSVRAANVLQQEGLRTVGDLVRRSPSDLMRVANCGRHTIREIERLLEPMGVCLRQKMNVR